MDKNFQWWLARIDRIGAWTLLITVVLFFASSYGMEKGFFDRQLAKQLHTGVLPVIGVIAFLMHTGPAIRIALMRWKLWNNISKIVLILVYTTLASGFVYAAYFYKTAEQNLPETRAPNQSAATTSQATGQTNTAPAEKTFTAQELTKYDGKNGNPAYTAVDGIVYDVSALFVNGQHRDCAAGQDITSEFYGEHGKQILANYAIVGKLKTN